MAGTELDQDLMSMFSCLGTQDKDVLVKELHSLLGSQLSDEGCAFFLDMTNWNLQAAVGAYYDYYSAQLPEMAVLRDSSETVGETVNPCSPFVKLWQLRNVGHESWPAGVRLLYTGGERMRGPSSLLLPALRPGEETSVCLRLQSPASPGLYQSQWKMCLPSGSLCGETLWLVITVVDDGVNRLTQQLSSISTAEGQMDTVSEETCTATTERSEQFNPFASPGSTRGAVSGTHSVANQEHSPSPQPIPALSDSQSSRLVLNGIQTGHTHSNAIDLLDNVGSVECQSSTVSATSLELHPLPGSTGCSVDYSDDMQS